MQQLSNVQAAARLRLALDMFELGESMMRERLRRKFPQANNAELEDLVARWLGPRPESGKVGDDLTPGRKA